MFKIILILTHLTNKYFFVICRIFFKSDTIFNSYSLLWKLCLKSYLLIDIQWIISDKFHTGTDALLYYVNESVYISEHPEIINQQ